MHKEGYYISGQVSLFMHYNELIVNHLGEWISVPWVICLSIGMEQKQYVPIHFCVYVTLTDKKLCIKEKFQSDLKLYSSSQ